MSFSRLKEYSRAECFTTSKLLPSLTETGAKLTRDFHGTVLDFTPRVDLSRQNGV